MLTPQNGSSDPTIRENQYKPLDLCRSGGVLQVERASSHRSNREQVRWAFGFHIISSGNPRRKGFLEDEHIPNLLLFNPQTRFHEEEVFQSGKVILQDKASCFSATVLAQGISEPHGDFIDATAAPGNKTTHLSALLGNKEKVSAFVQLVCFPTA